MDNHHGATTHLELDILQSEVKWDLGSITTNKASGDDGVSAELFKILKDNECCYSGALKVSANLENSAVATGWKRSVFIPVPKKASAKGCSNYLYNCVHFTC